VAEPSLELGDVMAERRRNANIPPETRKLMWRLRALWYGEWGV
jgi:hypothetical protein